MEHMGAFLCFKICCRCSLLSIPCLASGWTRTAVASCLQAGLSRGSSQWMKKRGMKKSDFGRLIVKLLQHSKPRELWPWGKSRDEAKSELLEVKCDDFADFILKVRTKHGDQEFLALLLLPQVISVISILHRHWLQPS